MTTRIGKILLVLSGAFILSGCDSIQALPANYNDPIVVNQDGTKTEVYENIMGVLYDGVSSNKKDDVLNNFIDIVCKETFGEYTELYQLVEEGDPDKLSAFALAHPDAYVRSNKIYNAGGELTEDEYLAKIDGVDVKYIRAQRVEDFYEQLSKEVNKSFYNEITSKSYCDETGKFFERRLAYAHYAELYDVKIDASLEWYEGYLTSELKEEDVSSFIHFNDGRYLDYISRKLIRSIYRDKLVEEYLVDNNYSTLGRAYGRKVNIIKLTRDEKFKDLPNALLNAYATNYIHTGADIDFEDIASAWKGFKGVDQNGNAILFTSTDIEYTLLKACKLKPIEKGVGSGKYYFAETQYGQLLEKYKLAENAVSNRYAKEEEQSALSEFTGSYTYTKERGLIIKTAELALKDYTTDGWYVKNGGLTELPEAIRNRLFNINVSNEVDNVDESTYVYEQTDYTRYIKGHYYLTPATSEAGDNNNFIIYDDGSFYMVEVVEAVSTSKLDIDGKEGYITKRSDEGAMFSETIARELAKILGTKDSYVNNAYSSVIEKYAVKYHDSSIYDYFKEKYPELFE